MPIYNVHVYTLVRVFVPSVEAESMQAAIDAAVERVDFHQLLDNGLVGGVISEYCEGDDYDSFLVDVIGDEDYEQSQVFDGEGRPMTTAGHQVLIWKMTGDETAISIDDEVFYMPGRAEQWQFILQKLSDLGQFFVRKGVQLENNSDHGKR